VAADRFVQPSPGAPVAVRFPRIERDVLASGLGVWSIVHDVAPVVTAAIVFTRGTADDPLDCPGLAGLTTDLLDEGADGRSAIELAEAMSRLGTHLDSGIAPDMLTLGFTAVARVFPAALDVLAGVIRRPHMAIEDLNRIRELRISRLRQLRQSGAALAERAFLTAVFGAHGYGHGALGTTASLGEVTVDDARAWYAGAIRPTHAILIVSGDITHSAVLAAARRAFDGWIDPQGAAETAPARPSGRGAAIAQPDPAVLLIDRPAAPQSELRVGLLGPPRRVDAYHSLVTMNAALGGQFSSRINRHLREARGWTYGARTALDLRRDAGTFSCETSVQADATASAVADILDEFRAIRGPRPVAADELDRAKRSLTRGYVRLFETAANLASAAAQLAAMSLPDDTFDRFVPGIGAVTEADILAAANRVIRPDECVTVVVGDAGSCRDRLAEAGRRIVDTTPEM
jgi:zinc protease